MKKRLVVVTMIIIVSLIIIGTTAVADDLEDKRNDIQNNINEATNELQQIEITLTETLNELGKLDERISNYRSSEETIMTELEEVFNNTKLIEEELKTVEEDYAKQKDSFEKRLVAQYEAGETGYLDVLVRSSSIQEFISNYFLISEIAEHDAELLNTIDRERNLIAEIKVTLEEKSEQLKNLKNNREKTAIALENAQVIRNDYVQQLTEEEQTTQSKIDIFRKELDEINAQILSIALTDVGVGYVGRRTGVAGTSVIQQ